MAAKADGEFQIALALSGAISAGAYTAGVFDFLIQALDEWENARTGKYLEQGDDPGTIPNHFVGIKAISGVSAGSIAAAIGAIALAYADQKPIEFETPRDGEQKIICYLPKLYEAWVVKPGLVAEGEEKIDFLQTSDFDGVPEETAPRPYISKTLHIYMTLSNLRGVPYSAPFDGGTEPKNENCYHMISHGDRVHYAVTGLGTWNSTSEFADKDQKREIAAAWLVRPDDPDWKDYAICALASAAFPVGLAARLIGSTLGKDPKLDEYEGRLWPTDALPLTI
jgi:hypothetical protein